MKAPDRALGFRDGIRHAVTWLHKEAASMNDPWAKAVLNCAAHGLGIEGKEATIAAKAELLEIVLARAEQRKLTVNGN